MILVFSLNIDRKNPFRIFSKIFEKPKQYYYYCYKFTETICYITATSWYVPILRMENWVLLEFSFYILSKASAPDLNLTFLHLTLRLWL